MKIGYIFVNFFYRLKIWYNFNDYIKYAVITLFKLTC